MKDYRYIILRVVTVFFLLASSVNLSGCTAIGNAVSYTFSTAYNIVMWPPRQAWKYTGGKLFDVKNDQQTDLGPRRKPTGNPTGRGPILGYSETATVGSYPSMPQMPAPTMPSMPRSQDLPQGPSDIIAPYPSMPGDSGGFPKTGYNTNPQFPQAMPPVREDIPSMGQNINMGPQAGTYPSVSPYGGDMGGTANSTMPPMPSEYGAQNQAMQPPKMPSPPGAMPSPYSAQGQSRLPPYGSPGGQIPSSNMDSMEADEAYSGGGGRAQKKWWSWIPFTSSQYKMDIKYELMAADIKVSAKDFYEGNYPQSDPVNIEPLENNEKGYFASPVRKKKASRTASMFPLEQYAPKPTVFAKKTDVPGGDYPKLADTPSNAKNPEDVEAAEKTLEKIINESETIQEKQGEIHNTKPTQKPAKKDDDSSQNINDANGYNLTNRSDKKSTSSRYETLGSQPLKNDAAILDTIEKKADYTSKPSAEQQKKPGFFSRLFGWSSEKPSSKIMTRKSQPPSPAEITKSITNPEIAMQSNQDAVKKYQPPSGSLLPKSRYTDRRKVPQTDE